MNQPEYIPVDVMGEIAANVKTALTLPVLNYQYGEYDELTTTLQQWTKTKGSANDKSAQRFPLFWFVQPFKIARGKHPGFYGLLSEAKIFLVQQSQKSYKADQRMTNVYKPILYPIYRETLNQILLHGAFTGSGEELGVNGIVHDFMDRYYFGQDREKTS